MVDKIEPPDIQRFTEEFYIEHGTHIHHLLIKSGRDHFIKHCQNLHNVAVWCSTSPNILDDLGALRLERLSIDIIVLFQSTSVTAFQRRVEASPPLFADLTHLEMITFCENWDGWTAIALLPKLTHLAVENGVAPEEPVTRDALDHCRWLRVLVFVSGSGDAPRHINVQQRDGCGRGADLRVVHIEYNNNGRYEEDWEAGARGRLDMWSLADEIVKARLGHSKTHATEA